MELTKELKEILGKDIKAAKDLEIYQALVQMTEKRLQERETNKGDKKLYYVSAEFLIGKLLSNNLINLGLYDQVEEVLKAAGKSLSIIEELEAEPSLGNGGLGRLAACYLDSVATLGLCGDGVGLNYHFGLFHQFFEEHKQKECPDPWLGDGSWLRKTKVGFTVPFGDFQLRSVMYDLDIAGFQKGKNTLHLFDLETVDESIVEEGIDFDKKDYARNLTLFLYPDDSDRAGRLLRVYQQYFMVSNGAQLILKELSEKGYALRDLAKHAVVQINDTHPSMIIPELIRLLTADGISMDEAISIVTQTCAYTNHTILAEALEKWPLEFLQEAVPQLVPIIRELDKRVKTKNPKIKEVILDENGLVHMAHMDIHYGFSVNGVAALHTEILKASELKGFYDLYPDKFTNKTNGITFRRWMMHCNPGLSQYITSLIGEGWKQDSAQLEQLLSYKEDTGVQSRILELKQANKRSLKKYLLEDEHVEVDENSVFDIQIKRLHEYKRQQMNALYLIWKYRQIKAGRLPKRAVTVIFGAKAAPAYIIAKDIIHLILCLQNLINNDPQVSPWLKVIMVENYNVSYAEKLIPACDISEQISLASKEASGTGNMKLMLNGALTLGTMDGANVEIYELVGKENIYLFGESSERVMELYEKSAYRPEDFYPADKEITELVDFIISPLMMRMGDPINLGRLYKDMSRKDWFMALLDLKDYIAVKEKMLEDYEDRMAWAKKMIVNIGKAGFFSSDRAIEEYNKDIWKLD